MQFPQLTGRVVDEAGLLTAAERQSLAETLKAHEESTGNQVVVVTLETGRWIVDTNIAIPKDAQPGVYFVEAVLAVKGAAIRDRMSFSVDP